MEARKAWVAQQRRRPAAFDALEKKFVILQSLHPPNSAGRTLSRHGTGIPPYSESMRPCLARVAPKLTVTVRFATPDYSAFRYAQAGNGVKHFLLLRENRLYKAKYATSVYSAYTSIWSNLAPGNVIGAAVEL